MWIALIILSVWVFLLHRKLVQVIDNHNALVVKIQSILYDIIEKQLLKDIEKMEVKDEDNV